MNTLNPSQFSKKKDFLAISDRSSVINDLKTFGDIDPKGDCLSDFVFVYDKKLKKKRLAMVITNKFVLLYDYRQWKLVYTNELANLTAVSIASKNCTLLSLHF